MIYAAHVDHVAAVRGQAGGALAGEDRSDVAQTMGRGSFADAQKERILDFGREQMA
jgi:hypothetical protein